jgi:hypothetical protein
MRGGGATEGVGCVSSGLKEEEEGVFPLEGAAEEESAGSGAAAAAAGSFVLVTATTGFAGLWELK